LEPDVRSAALTQTPAGYEQLLRGSIDIIRVGDDVWNVVVGYVEPNSLTMTPVVVGDVRYSITNSTGDTYTQKESTELVEEYQNTAAGYSWMTLRGTPMETNLGLEWYGGPTEGSKGSISCNGIPTRVGTVEVRFDTAITAAQATGGYLVNAAAAAASNTVNTDLYIGFAAGTLRMLSYQASERGQEPSDLDGPDWDVSFSALFSPNITIQSATFGAIPKQGHEWLEYLFVKKTVTVGGRKVSGTIPARAAVHKRYPEGSFSSIIGTPLP
jgi:hypothetical protein